MIFKRGILEICFEYFIINLRVEIQIDYQVFKAGSEKCENALKMAASINCTDLSSSQVLTNAIQIFSYYFTENDADECVLPLCEQFFVRKMKTEELKGSYKNNYLISKQIKTEI